MAVFSGVWGVRCGRWEEVYAGSVVLGGVSFIVGECVGVLVVCPAWCVGCGW